nr:MAG TPA: hypothetical protein [Caudoviricetes sp.]DAP69278.1 MAG TPA: hypothetical protein [Caudoviricetes sp.]
MDGLFVVYVYIDILQFCRLHVFILVFILNPQSIELF